jgi:hypothetical protein
MERISLYPVSLEIYPLEKCATHQYEINYFIQETGTIFKITYLHCKIIR